MKKIYRIRRRGSKFAGVLSLLFCCAIVPVCEAGFTNTVTLVLRQGEVPTTNGAPIVGAPAYTGCVDTYIYRETPNTSYGNWHYANYGGAVWYEGNPVYACRAYIKFDLTTVLPSPSQARVISAKLYLTSAGDWGDSNGNQSDVYYMTVDWGTNITWNTRPPNGQPIGGVLREPWMSMPDGTVRYIELGSLVRAWHEGLVPNYGLTLNCNEDNEVHSGRSFYTSEAGEVTSRPKLEIVYAHTGIVTDHPLYNRDGLQHVIITNGADIFEDTYIAADHTNYVHATVADLRTYNDPGTPRRALIRLRSDSLAFLAKSWDPLQPAVPRLISAALQISTGHMSDNWFQLWTCSQDWSANAVTDLSRDGTNAWNQGWTSNGISNVSRDLGSRTFSSPYHGSCLLWDITDVVQNWVDGTNNYGFVLGHASLAAYLNEAIMTEWSIQHMRPTLILQTWTPIFRQGTVIIIQ